jgi:hypothetical protein
MKKSIVILTTAIIFISCKKNEIKNETNKPIEDSTKIQKVEVENFIIKNINKVGFEPFEDDKHKAYCKVDITILNNTKNKFTKFEVTHFLEAEYENGETVFYPKVYAGGYEHNLEESYKDYELNDKREILEKDDIWKPNELRTINCKIDAGWPGNGFFKSHFERTPTKLILHYTYNAVSVDGEYSDRLNLDVLDLWKKYQEKLGLR